MESVNDPKESPDDEVEAIDDDEVEENEDQEQTVVLSEDEFEDGEDISMEINVEKLVAEFEKSNSDDVHRRAEIRRRLEELVDPDELEDTYAIEFDD